MFHIFLPFWGEGGVVILRQVPTCDSAHSWWLHSVAPLGDQTTGNMLQFPTQSYLGTDLTSLCLILELAMVVTIINFENHWFEAIQILPLDLLLGKFVLLAHLATALELHSYEHLKQSWSGWQASFWVHLLPFLKLYSHSTLESLDYFEINISDRPL